MIEDYIARITDPAFARSTLDWLVTSGLRILLVVVIAFVAVKLVYRLIDGLEARIAARSGAFDSALETGRRLATVKNLLKHLVFIIIFGIAAMIVLRELGVDIAPIIAGAGIMGLAVSFGAQNLVRDIISGFFMIMEDQVRVGDVAVVNGTGGTVEEINFRTIVLRDLEGTVHVFPNGTVTQLANRSKGWSRYVIDMGVAYKENVDYVIEVMKKIGEEISRDKDFGPLILEPMQVLGVDSFGPSEVVIKCMIKTRPLKQWDVGRELRRRIKNRFDELGIEIPFPHMSIYFGEASKPFEVEVAGIVNGPGGSKEGPGKPGDEGEEKPRAPSGFAAPGQDTPGGD
ncbi:MAG TPA: mechanosensitive ion channel family protein [Thermodesulfobacteriota bacterium]|nr:mechanosensitive ion channel family protein [Thermodesulfobacteriota bacterium]